MKKDFVGPILALTLICLIMTGALAGINYLTRPVIDAAAAERAEAARRALLPQAEDFVPLETDGLPESIISAYAATNGVGYVFIVEVRGYGGDLQIISGVCPEGRIIASAVLEHSETVGLGTGVFDRAAAEEAAGGSLLDVDAIAGSTITLRAYQLALSEALAAFELSR